MTASTSQPPLHVDFLYWEDCPSHERALQLLREVIAEENVQAQIDVQEVLTEEDASRLRFLGSPTIRVNGEDIDPREEQDFSLTCRVYFLPNGRMSPLPARDTIALALQRARRVTAHQEPAAGI